MLNVKPYSKDVLHAVICIAQPTSRILFNEGGKFKKHRTADHPFCLFFPHIYFTCIDTNRRFARHKRNAITPGHLNINY
jgi:hypothetical protein